MSTIHGGLSAAELRTLGVSAEEVVDFSSNINPLGPSERVRDAAAAVDLAAYPDRDCLLLREALAERLQVEVGQLLFGNGSTELIHLLSRAVLRPGGRCLIFEPTFGEYEAAATLAGGQIHRLRAGESQLFRWSVESALDTIREVRPELTFLCSPNNPTGVQIGREDVVRILEAIGSDGLLLLDEAYASLAEGGSDSDSLAPSLLGGGNLAVLRSMTKDHALAGVRLGYLLAAPPLIDAVGRLQHVWSVNAVAQAAGLAALDDEERVAEARAVIAASKAFLYEQLGALGVPYTPSSANFLLVKVGDARETRLRLLRRGVAVRDCTSFGLPQHIRVAVRGREECERLIRELASLRL